MRYVAAIALALGLAAPALADEQTKIDTSKAQQNEPVAMTDAQLDDVAAGALINVGLNNTQVGVDAAVAVAANVLTSGSSAVANGQSGGVEQTGRGILFQQ